MNPWKKKPEKKHLPKRTKIILSVTAALLTAGALGTAAYDMFRKPRPKSEAREDIMKFVASADFNRLSIAERRKWLGKLRPEQRGKRRPPKRGEMQTMSGEERSAFRNNMRKVFEQERNRRMKQYFALQTQEEKKSILPEAMRHNRTNRYCHREEDRRRPAYPPQNR